MNKIFLSIITGFLFFSAGLLYSQNDCLKFIQKTRIGNKVLVVGIGDAVISILTKNGIVVVDVGESATLTGYYKKIIEQEFGTSKYAFLINTHPHFDHTGGNRAFSDIKIIGHENCINQIKNYKKEVERIKENYKKLVDGFHKKLRQSDIDSTTKFETLANICRYTLALNDMTLSDSITLPNVAFRHTMNLDMNDISLHLYYFGKAHTESDILIHIPEEKILLTGDLFLKGDNPSYKIHNLKDAEYGYNVINSFVMKNEIKTVITGHGDILTREDLNLFCENLKTPIESLKKIRIKK